VHGSGTGASSSGSSILEIEAGCQLPRHTDSAEETIVLVRGSAEVLVDGQPANIKEGIAVVPKGVPHEVRNIGDETLRFAAVYADADVTTTYDDEVQPDGGKERESTA
jgi:quercetin dioxygenase-like cupin family protein